MKRRVFEAAAWALFGAALAAAWWGMLTGGHQ